MQVAIVIPTMNRPLFVKRQLDFYKALGNKNPVYIGDSSESEQYTLLSNFIKNGDYSYSICQYQCQGMNDSEAILYCLEKSKESFSVFIGDDDFLVPESISKCANFLLNNPEFSSCHGEGLIFEADLVRQGRFKYSCYKMGELLNSRPESRLTSFLSHYYVILFSVHRTPEFISSFKKILNISDKGLREIVPNVLCAISGKSKKLNCLSVIRQTHQSRYLLPTTIDWLSQPSWSINFKSSIEIISTSLIEMSNLDKTRVEFIVKDGLKDYLALLHFNSFQIFSSHAALRRVFGKIWQFKVWIFYRRYLVQIKNSLTQ